MHEFFPNVTKFLLVDDVPYNNDAVKIVLRNFKNIKVNEAYDGLQAVDKIKQNFDLHAKGDRSKLFQYVITDWDMPIMDGMTETKHVREMAKKINHDIKIIILTALNAAEHMEKAKKLGADYIIGKPCTIDKILDIF